MKLWARRGGRRKIAVLIGEASTITGKCIFHGTTVLNGTVEGEILCRGTLTVGPRGLARANITADSVVIEGEVVGNVSVQERVELTVTARMVGDIQAPRDNQRGPGRRSAQSPLESPLRPGPVGLSRRPRSDDAWGRGVPASDPGFFPAPDPRSFGGEARWIHRGDRRAAPILDPLPRDLALPLGAAGSSEARHADGTPPSATPLNVGDPSRRRPRAEQPRPRKGRADPPS